MTQNQDELEVVIKEIVDWAQSESGKAHINDTYCKLQIESEKLREDITLSPEKLKLLIGI